MRNLKKAYELKKELVTKDISELGNILKQDSKIDTIDINSDNTIYLESNCGIDSIKNNLNEGIDKWVNVDNTLIRDIICNILPISSSSCIVRI